MYGSLIIYVVFPWETDADFQMLAESLEIMRKFNNTLYNDRYLIDINPHWVYRTKNVDKEDNVIDARFIGNMICNFERYGFVS